jgi:hypothetical protein
LAIAGQDFHDQQDINQMKYAEMYHTDPSICDEELTPEVLEEIGKCKHDIIKAVMPNWTNITEDDDVGVLGCELESLTPDFIRALALTLAGKAN